ncbi:MAG: hypothetical protein ACOYMV_13885 [Verrucomicrobiia bacterium]
MTSRVEVPCSAWVQAMLKQHGLEKYPVALIGMRGYLTAQMGIREALNVLGLYDDAILRVMPGHPTVGFRCSTDPGRYYLEHPLDPRGCAQLQPGLWWYELGLHRGKPALKQAGAFTVNRLEPDEDIACVTTSEGSGIDIHSGGAGEEVDRFSAGCQVIYDSTGSWGDDWHDFYDPIAEAKPARVPYLLVNAPEAFPV